MKSKFSVMVISIILCLFLIQIRAEELEFNYDYKGNDWEETCESVYT